MYMQKSALSLLAFVLLGQLHAQDVVEMSPIDVNGTQAKEESLQKSLKSLMFDTNALAKWGKPANTSAFGALAYSPSVSFQSADAFGSNESSFHDPIRIRSKNQSGPGGILLFEGVPMNGNPGGGKTVYDMENIANLTLYKGYVPVEKGLGFSNLIGKVDMSVLRPKEELGLTATHMAGSFATQRTFVRVDTGKIGDVAAFGSLSYTQGEKWKGEGDYTRLNAMVGATYTPSDALKIELFALHNQDKHHNYDQLTYAQASAIESNYNADYSTTNTKIGGYYDYNRQEFNDTALMANFDLKLSDAAHISLKPYFLVDQGNYWFAQNESNASATQVVNWLIDHNLFGALAQYDHTVMEALKLKVGYWAHWQLPPGPPTLRKMYSVASGTPTFSKIINETRVTHHEFHSPFVGLSGAVAALRYEAGLRYVNFKLSGLESYLDLDNNASTPTTLDSYSSVDAKYYHILLPNAHASYALTPEANLFASYARTYGYDVNLFPSYLTSRSTFVSKSITMQSLWDKQNPELSDNLDVGAHLEIAGITLKPSAYMTVVTGKQATIYDADLNASYPTNNANAMSYGAELAIEGEIAQSLTYMLNAAYNRYFYTQDIQTNSSTTIAVNGNQVPDSPRWLGSATMTYTLGGLSITPAVRYVGTRFGDIQNTQSVPAYTVADMDVAYTHKNTLGFKEATMRFAINNLLNTRYIASIITPDNALVTSNSTYYQMGAPLSLYASLALVY
ncbi:MAG: hypothetical protein KU37_03640 [Sulfuricurvum sp. PC08-66]|nr:MAG: hypothetical protein KU37_03640 [Sulfuricurvum sp. PC08-66]